MFSEESKRLSVVSTRSSREGGEMIGVNVGGKILRKEVLGLIAIKAANERYWMVLEEETQTGVLAVGLPPVKKRYAAQQFYLEVYDAHLFALKNLKTNRYIRVNKDEKETITCSAKQLSEDCLFKLNLKVPYFIFIYFSCFLLIHCLFAFFIFILKKLIIFFLIAFLSDWVQDQLSRFLCWVLSKWFYHSLFETV